MCGISGDSNIQRRGEETKKKALYPGFDLPSQFISSLIQTCHPPTYPSRKTGPGRGLGQSPGFGGLSLSLCLAHTEARNES